MCIQHCQTECTLEQKRKPYPWSTIPPLMFIKLGYQQTAMKTTFPPVTRMLRGFLMWGVFLFSLWKCIPFNCSFWVLSIAEDILDVNLKSINFKDEKSNDTYSVNFKTFLYTSSHNTEHGPQLLKASCLTINSHLFLAYQVQREISSDQSLIGSPNCVVS